MNQATPRDVKPEGGFTMVEVMIAILLTAIAIIGIMALFMTEMKASSYSRHATEATVLAADKLEKLRTMAIPVNDADATTIDSNGASGGIYTRSWQVASMGGTPATYLDVSVTVSWDENGETKSIILHGRRQP